MKKSTIVIICLCVILILALLIGTIIVSLGIMLHNTTTDVNNNTSIEEIMNSIPEICEIEDIDSEVRRYEGEKIDHIGVSILITKIKLHNEYYEENEKIKIEYISKTGVSDVFATAGDNELEKIRSLLVESRKYKVSISQCDADGLISTMAITEL